MGGYTLKWLEMAQNGQELLEQAGSSWKWLGMGKTGWNGWKWLEMA